MISKKLLTTGIAMVCSVGAITAGDNLLTNPSFEQNSEGSAQNWICAKVDTFRASDGKFSTVLDGSNRRVQQVISAQELGKYFDSNTELEYSLMVYVEELRGGGMFHTYMESASDKFIASKENLGIEPGKWYRIRMRFKLPKKLNHPRVGMNLVGGGVLHVDDVYFGPASKAPSMTGERVPDKWDKVYNAQGVHVEVPVVGTLLFGTNSPKNWQFDAQGGVAGYSNKESMFELRSEKDGVQPQAMFQSAVNLPAPGTDLDLSLNASTLGNPSTRFTTQLNYLKNGKVIGSSLSNEFSIYVGTEKVTLNSKVPEGGADSVQILVKMVTPGRLIFNDASLRVAQEERAIDEYYVKYNLYSRILDLPSRRTYVLPEKPQKMTIECIPDTDTLTVELNEIYGKNIKNYTFSDLKPNQINTFVLEVPELPEGAYELRMKTDKLVDFYEFFRIRQPQTKGVAFDRNNWMKLDGEYFFPIALNHIPMNNDDFFRVAAESGINTLGFYGPDFIENDRAFNYMKKMAEKYDFSIFAWDERISDPRREEDLFKSLENFNDKLKTLPKFIGFLDDETAARNYTLEKAVARCKYYFKEFPDYILWQNHAPRIVNSTSAPKNHYFPFIRHFSQPYDLLSVDIYPVPEGVAQNQLPNRYLSCVGDYTDITRATGWNQKPVWMILQGWGWGENVHAPIGLDKMPRPNYKQLRFMAYDVLLCGATGIDWHTEGGKGQGPCNEVYDAWWQDFSLVNRELAEVGNLIVGSEVSDLDIQLPKELLGKRFKTADNEVLIIVNETRDIPATVDLRFNKRYYMAPSGKPYINGKVIFNGYDTLVLTTKPVKVERKVYTSQGVGQPLIENRNVEIPAQWVKPSAPTFNDIFSSEFTLDKVPAAAKMQIHAEGHWQFFINGKKVDGATQRRVYEYNVAEFLKEGKNIVEVKLTSPGRNKGIAWAIFDGEKVFDATGKNTVARAEENGTNAPVLVIGPHGPNPQWKYTGKLSLSPAY